MGPASASTPRRRARRPVAALLAVFLGLGAVGTAAGAALGAVGAASSGAPAGHGHHHVGPGPDGPRLPGPRR
jgi:hypothetical protein